MSTYRNTRIDVENALRELNEAARALDLDRRFDIRYGSASAGVSHVLEEIHPGLSHPTDTPIGRTLREAHDYLGPMTHALRSVKRDRDYRRENTTGEFPLVSRGAAPANSVGIFDPDARSVTRAAHEVDPARDRTSFPTSGEHGRMI